MHRRLLEQMECLCKTVHNMRDRVEGKIAQKRLLRDKSVRMDERFKDEELARELVQNDLAVGQRKKTWCG